MKAVKKGEGAEPEGGQRGGLGNDLDCADLLHVAKGRDGVDVDRGDLRQIEASALGSKARRRRRPHGRAWRRRRGDSRSLRWDRCRT